MMTSADRTPRPAVSVALFKDGEVLLVKRCKAPAVGLWSLPGGSIHWGEAVEAAARRELYEETGLAAGPLILCAVHDAIEKGAATGQTLSHHVISVFAARHRGGSPLAMSDALEACWHRLDELERLPLTLGLAPVIFLAAETLERAGA